MRVEPGTEEEALASLPETFELVEGERELTAEEFAQAVELVKEAAQRNPDQKYFRIVLDA